MKSIKNTSSFLEIITGSSTFRKHGRYRLFRSKKATEETGRKRERDRKREGENIPDNILLVLYRAVQLLLQETGPIPLETVFRSA